MYPSYLVQGIRPMMIEGQVDRAKRWLEILISNIQQKFDVNVVEK